MTQSGENKQKSQMPTNKDLKRKAERIRVTVQGEINGEKT